MIPSLSILPEYNAPKSIPENQMQVEYEKASNNLAVWARKNMIQTKNFKSQFCYEQNCHRYSSEGWLYREYNHLSPAGANLTTAFFENYLFRLK